jgi:hypothetical protein
VLHTAAQQRAQEGVCEAGITSWAGNPFIEAHSKSPKRIARGDKRAKAKRLQQNRRQNVLSVIGRFICLSRFRPFEGDKLVKAKKSLDEYRTYLLPDMMLENHQLERLGFAAEECKRQLTV